MTCSATASSSACSGFGFGEQHEARLERSTHGLAATGAQPLANATRQRAPAACPAAWRGGRARGRTAPRPVRTGRRTRRHARVPRGRRRGRPATARDAARRRGMRRLRRARARSRRDRPRASRIETPRSRRRPRGNAARCPRRRLAFEARAHERCGGAARGAHDREAFAARRRRATACAKSNSRPSCRSLRTSTAAVTPSSSAPSTFVRFAGARRDEQVGVERPARAAPRTR